MVAREHDAPLQFFIRVKGKRAELCAVQNGQVYLAHPQPPMSVLWETVCMYGGSIDKDGQYPLDPFMHMWVAKAQIEWREETQEGAGEKS